MIANVNSSVSSVTALAERCCRESGTTLEAVLAVSHRKWSRPMRLAVDDAVYRMKHSDHPPSFTEIAAAFGYRGHVPTYEAYRRAAKRRMMVQYHESYTVGMAVVAGLPDDAPIDRPMYDDGEDDRDGRGMSEGSVATRYRAGGAKPVKTAVKDCV